MQQLSQRLPLSCCCTLPLHVKVPRPCEREKHGCYSAPGCLSMYLPAQAHAMLHQGAQCPRQETYDTSSDHQALTPRFGGRPRAEPSGDRVGRAQAGPDFMQGIGKAYPTTAARKAAGSWAARLAGKAQRAGLQTPVRILMFCGAVCMGRDFPHRMPQTCQDSYS